MKTDTWILVIWMTTTYCFHVEIGLVPEGGDVLTTLSRSWSVRIRLRTFHGIKLLKISRSLGLRQETLSSSMWMKVSNQREIDKEERLNIPV